MTSATYKAPESSEGTAGRAPAGLGRFGVWATSWTAKPDLAVAAERLGYGAIWLGSADGELRLAEEMLDATSTITVATGDREHRGACRRPLLFLIVTGVPVA